MFLYNIIIIFLNNNLIKYFIYQEKLIFFCNENDLIEISIKSFENLNVDN